jgi:hypothetical protein
MNKTKTYNSLIEDLKKSLNERLTKSNKEHIKAILRELNTKDFNFTLLSKKFLKNLMKDNDNRTNTNNNMRIHRLNKDENIKVKTEYRFYREFNTQNTTRAKERLNFLVVA